MSKGSPRARPSDKIALALAPFVILALLYMLYSSGKRLHQFGLDCEKRCAPYKYRAKGGCVCVVEPASSDAGQEKAL